MGNDKTVLIVDDEAYIRRVIEFKLKKRGYRIIMARNGEEGLNIIKTQHPDVVISDLNMPIMDGKTLCNITDKLKEERPFLTIIITARISPDDREWSKNMRDTLFMEKPFSPAQILESIEQYFRIQK